MYGLIQSTPSVFSISLVVLHNFGYCNMVFSRYMAHKFSCKIALVWLSRYLRREVIYPVSVMLRHWCVTLLYIARFSWRYLIPLWASAVIFLRPTFRLFIFAKYAWYTSFWMLQLKLTQHTVGTKYEDGLYRSIKHITLQINVCKIV